MINWSINQETGRKIKKSIFENTITKAFEILKIKNADISIAIVFKEKIKEVNKKYRHKNYITDVLSFVYEKNPLDGEILICYDKISEQAKEKGNSFNDELKILLIHSLVHLAGYDHKKDTEAKKMKKVEDEIKSQL